MTQEAPSCRHPHPKQEGQASSNTDCVSLSLNHVINKPLAGPWVCLGRGMEITAFVGSFMSQAPPHLICKFSYSYSHSAAEQTEATGGG